MFEKLKYRYMQLEFRNKVSYGISAYLAIVITAYLETKINIKFTSCSEFQLPVVLSYIYSTFSGIISTAVLLALQFTIYSYSINSMWTFISKIKKTKKKNRTINVSHGSDIAEYYSRKMKSPSKIKSRLSNIARLTFNPFSAIVTFIGLCVFLVSFCYSQSNMFICPVSIQAKLMFFIINLVIGVGVTIGFSLILVKPMINLNKMIDAMQLSRVLGCKYQEMRDFLNSSYYLADEYKVFSHSEGMFEILYGDSRFTLDRGILSIRFSELEYLKKLNDGEYCTLLESLVNTRKFNDIFTAVNFKTEHLSVILDIHYHTLRTTVCDSNSGELIIIEADRRSESNRIELDTGWVTDIPCMGHILRAIDLRPKIIIRSYNSMDQVIDLISELSRKVYSHTVIDESTGITRYSEMELEVDESGTIQ